MGLLRKISSFYADGFRSMTVGRSLWVLIIVKLAIMFAVLKVFFFPDLLGSRHDTDGERAEAVRDSLTGDRN